LFDLIGRPVQGVAVRAQSMGRAVPAPDGQPYLNVSK
jgi:hypothetical protein